MAQNEVEFLFKARDEVSKQLAEINRQINATGAASTTAGKATSGLTQYVRGLASEQRTANTILRQTQGIIGATSIVLASLNGATLGAGESVRTLTNSLSQGFVAFSALQFAIGGLLGPWGLLVSAIGGATVALISYNAEQEKARREVDNLKTANAILAASVGGWDSDVIVELGKAYRKADDELKALEATVSYSNKDHEEAIGKKLRAEKAYKDAVKKFGDDIRAVNKKIDDEAKANAEKAKKAAEDLAKANEAQFARVFPLQAALNQSIQDRIALYQRLGGVASQQAIDEEKRLNALKNQRETPLPKVQESLRPALNDTLNLQEQIIANFRQMGTETEQLADAMTNIMTDAANTMAGVFTGAFKSIGDAFRALIQSMIAELVRIGFLRLFASLVAAPATGGASIAANAASQFGPPIPKAGVRQGGETTININVNGEAQRSVRGRTQLYKELDDVFLSEKFQ